MTSGRGGSVDAGRIAKRALEQHARYRGKVQMMPKCPIEGLDDFAIWYTPGVAAPCRAIHGKPDNAYQYTNKGNTVAIVSDGSRILGLGNMGPLAGLPVMEGKALLFKYMGGVDAVPLCVDTQSPEALVATVKALEPSFGGINLEDIAQPKCFAVLDELKQTLGVPVWHDDQQGTAVVVLGALINALKVVGKTLDDVRIAMVGMGAANVANYRLLKAAGADTGAIIACDTGGILGAHRGDIENRRRDFKDKWDVCRETNVDCIKGGVADALRGADICLAFSQPDPGTIEPIEIAHMAKDAIVFACANPSPEIWPQDAVEAGAAIAATGRSDFANQVNNALAFPGVFRGILDIRARTITDEMAISAAQALADCAGDGGQIGPSRILPRLDEWQVASEVAVATAGAAQRQGVAGLQLSAEQIRSSAVAKIEAAQREANILADDACR